MLMAIMMILMILIITLMLFFINLLIMKKMFNLREKISPLECGFDMMNKTSLPFSIQFFYIAILFLIFDVELSLLLPMIQKLFSFLLNKWFYTFFFIILLLMIGFYIEWWNNLIKWNN